MFRQTPERFWSRAIPEPNSGCWLWCGSVNRRGYGKAHLGHEQLAHRVAWKLSGGAIPRGAHVLHRCDTPSCVNPSHLFVGTHADNMRDKVAKGRQARFAGSDHPSAKLSVESVREIRAAVLPRNRWSPSLRRQLAAKFGVSESAIKQVRSRRSWACVQDEEKVLADASAA